MLIKSKSSMKHITDDLESVAASDAVDEVLGFKETIREREFG